MSARVQRRHDDGEREEYRGHLRPTEKRAVPFLGALLVAFVVMPGLFFISRLVFLWDQTTGIMVANAWFLAGAGLALAAVGVGLFHARRTNFLIKHVALTLLLVGFAGNFYTLGGFHHRLWNVMAVFGTAMLWGSWMLYRIDAFRAKAKGESETGWGELIGLARSRPRKIRTTDTHMFVDVEHGPGETGADVAGAAKRLESAVGAIAGGTVVTPGDRADTSHLSFEMADAFADWRSFPGLSHPGQTFALPFRTAYYATGVDEWFSFAATSGRRSPLTDFVSEADTFVGAAGLTGMGKSGFLNNAAAEGLSRLDCIVCWLDKEKFLQNAGWAADMLGMGGNGEDSDGTPSNAKDFTRALRELARYRVGVFGQLALDAAVNPDSAGEDMGRSWTPELARETGEAAVLVIVDEADTAIHTEHWRWLSARARSLGIFLLPASPRVSTAEVPAIVRGSIGAWKTFGVGDNYSQGFTLSQATEDAGADPTKFREPGLHYLDRAPGVDPRMYPVKAREFRSHTKTLRRMVLQARRSFNPAVFSQGAVEAMGDYYWRCHPRVVLKLETAESLRAKFDAGVPLESEYVPPGAFDLEQTMPMSEVEAYVRLVASGELGGTPEQVAQARRILAANQPKPAAPAAPQAPPASRPREDHDEQDEDEMGSSATGTDVDEDRVATIDHRAAGISDDELEREVREADPREPINTSHEGESVRLDAEDPDKPRWNPEQTEAEFDRTLAEFASAGKMTFTNQEVMEAMRCEFNAVTCSRRLHGLAETERIVPPGLKVERTDRTGTWLIVRSSPSPRPR